MEGLLVSEVLLHPSPVVSILVQRLCTFHLPKTLYPQTCFEPTAPPIRHRHNVRDEWIVPVSWRQRFLSSCKQRHALSRLQWLAKGSLVLDVGLVVTSASRRCWHGRYHKHRTKYVTFTKVIKSCGVEREGGIGPRGSRVTTQAGWWGGLSFRRYAVRITAKLLGSPTDKFFVIFLTVYDEFGDTALIMPQPPATHPSRLSYHFIRHYTVSAVERTSLNNIT